MSDVKSLVARSAAAAELFFHHLEDVAADPKNVLSLRAATLMLRRPAVVGELCRNKMVTLTRVPGALETCVRHAVAQNDPILMHYTTALMGTLLTGKVLLAADLGSLVSPSTLAVYESFRTRIPNHFLPKGPTLLLAALPSTHDKPKVLRAVRTSAPDLLAPSSVVKGREKAFSAQAYGGYMLSLLEAVDADLANLPLMNAAFSGVSWELARLTQKKNQAEPLPQFSSIVKTLQHIALSGMELKSPLAVHHSLRTLNYFVAHSYLSLRNCTALTSPECLRAIGQSLSELHEAGYTGRLGQSGQMLFVKSLEISGLYRPSQCRVVTDVVQSMKNTEINTPTEAFAKAGVLKAVDISFEAANRFKRTVPLCQLQALAHDVGLLAVEAAYKGEQPLLSGAVVAMGALMEAHKSVRPALFKAAVKEPFVTEAFVRVAAPLLRREASVETRHVMRYFEQLRQRRLLPEVLTRQVKAYTSGLR